MNYEERLKRIMNYEKQSEVDRLVKLVKSQLSRLDKIALVVSKAKQHGLKVNRYLVKENDWWFELGDCDWCFHSYVWNDKVAPVVYSLNSNGELLRDSQEFDTTRNWSSRDRALIEMQLQEMLTNINIAEGEIYQDIDEQLEIRG